MTAITPDERAGRRAVDPADPLPERVLAQPLEEAELEQQAVHPSPGEDEREIPVLHFASIVLA